MKYLYTFACIALLNIKCAEPLECFSCSNISDVQNCFYSTQCQYGQSCFLDMKLVGQSTAVTLGCTDNKSCGTLSSAAPGLVGRDLLQRQTVGRDLSQRQTVGRDLSQRQTDTCHECCSTDNCNKHLCKHSKPTDCIDDAKADCAWMNAIFNICQDVRHAKTVCPRFCGLCSLVDGNWADWSVWTACDVTCDNGTRTRTRKCTNPPPSNGGLDCAGNDTDVIECQRPLCPVHGGWSSWSMWGTCSATCDTGIQSRRRNCSNPHPDRFGDNCYGESMESRLCKPGPCANGGWSSWGTWSNCSVTCGGGFKTRSRTCTNPPPSPRGRHCEGDTMHIASCSNEICRNSYNTASQTIAFRSKNVSDITLQKNQTIIFGTTILNLGDGYDNTTGIFTAPIGGWYSISIQLCHYAHEINYAIMSDSTELKRGMFMSTRHSCSGANTVTLLKPGDHVYVKLTRTGILNHADGLWNMFSGFLLKSYR